MNLFSLATSTTLILFGVLHTQLYFEQWGTVGVIGPVGIAAGTLVAAFAAVTSTR